MVIQGSCGYKRGAPRYGRSNIVLNELYNGNPWGAGGRDFIAIGNQHRDPGYAENTLKPILKNKGSSIPPSRKLKKELLGKTENSKIKYYNSHTCIIFLN